MKADKVSIVPPDNAKMIPCESRMLACRILDTKATATVPNVVIRWALGFSKVPKLRTFIYLKYIQAQNEFVDIDIAQACADMQISRPTLDSHLDWLTKEKWLGRAKNIKGRYFFRAWKTIIAKVYEYTKDVETFVRTSKNSKQSHCILPLSYLGSKSGFKALLSAHLIGNSIISQEKMRRRAPKPKTPSNAGEPQQGGSLSNQNFARVLNVSIPTASRIRRMAVDHDFLTMTYMFSKTEYTRWHLEQVRAGNAEIENLERMKLFGDEVWEEHSPWLGVVHLPTANVKRKNYAQA